jgi:L-aminopeptidase/D-esterase-like protein
MRFLAEAGAGFPTPVQPIPLVAASVIYDLLLSQGAAHPDAELGYTACRAAHPLPVPPAAQGNAGAGAGATVGKWGGPSAMMKGGLGYDERRAGNALVAAIAVVNAVGDVVAEDGSVLAGARHAGGGWLVDTAPERWLPDRALFRGTNTTLAAVLTDAALSKPQASRLAQRAHDGIARAVLPAHTDHDGDTAYALAAGTREAPYDLVAAQAVSCVSEAIRNAVRNAAPAGGIPGLRQLPAPA